MAFVAGAAGRAAAGRAAGSAAARSGAGKAAGKTASKAGGAGSRSAFGTKARAAGDPALAKEIEDFNAVDDPPKPAPAPSSPQPAAEPAPSSGGSSGGGPKSSAGATAGAAFRKLSSASEGTPDYYRRAQRYSSPTVVANAGGGALLGLVAYVVALTYLRDGREGVKALYRAKFLNQTTGGGK